MVHLVEGVSYASIAQVAAQYKIPATTLQGYMARKGGTLEDAVRHFKIRGKYAAEFIFRGRDFGHVKKACSYYGISYSALYSMKSAEDLPVEITLERFIAGVYPTNQSPVSVGSIRYPSKAAAARVFRIASSELAGKDERVIQERIELAIHQQLRGRFAKECAELKQQRGLSLEDCREYYFYLGLSPQHLLHEFQTKGHLPRLIRNVYNPLYINRHYVPSIRVAAILWGLEVNQIYELTREDAYSLNGAVIHLLKQKKGERY